MKKVLLSGVVAFAAITAVAQSNTSTSNAQMRSNVSAPYAEQPSIFAPESQLGNIDKDGPETYYISYPDYNLADVGDQFIDGGRYQINSNFAPLDSGFTSMSVSLQPYIGFYDYNDVVGTYAESNPGAPGAKLRIDSVSILLGHANHTGQPNRLYTSLTGAASGTFGSLGTLYFPNNTVFWKDSIVTTTSLSPSGSPFGTNSGYVWDMAPNYLHSLSATSHICVKFDAFLPMGDTVGVSGLYEVDQNGTDVPPLIYNSFARLSDTPGSIFVYGINWVMSVKVTYTSNASINQLEANGFTIHNLIPNPARDFSTIRYELKNSADVKFVVTDMTGKQISQVQINGQAGTSDYQLNTAELAAGYYNVSMLVNGQVFTQKLNVVK